MSDKVLAKKNRWPTFFNESWCRRLCFWLSISDNFRWIIVARRLTNRHYIKNGFQCSDPRQCDIIQFGQVILLCIALTHFSTFAQKSTFRKQHHPSSIAWNIWPFKVTLEISQRLFPSLFALKEKYVLKDRRIHSRYTSSQIR